MIPLMPQYRAWVDFSVHAVPVGWGSSSQERRRAAENDLVISLVQSAHNKAAWQRRQALGFFQAISELFCCTTSVDTDELRI